MSMVSPQAELNALNQIRVSLEERAQNLINILNSKPTQDNAIALDLRDVKERISEVKQRELILQEQLKIDSAVSNITDKPNIPTQTESKPFNPLILLGGLALALLI